jgi:hypothetical protein
MKLVNCRPHISTQPQNTKNNFSKSNPCELKNAKDLMNGCPKCIDKITPNIKILKVKPPYVNKTKEINKISNSTLHTLTKPFKIPRNF